MKVLKSMKIGKKIGVIVVAMLIPIALLATLYAQNSLREVTRVTRQAGGIPYVVEARNLMQAPLDAGHDQQRRQRRHRHQLGQRSRQQHDGRHKQPGAEIGPARLCARPHEQGRAGRVVDLDRVVEENHHAVAGKALQRTAKAHHQFAHGRMKLRQNTHHDFRAVLLGKGSGVSVRQVP